MENQLLEALRTKYQALKADFGDKAAERLREVVEHALEQIAGPERGLRSAASPAAADGGARRSRTWSPAQRAEQKKKMQAYWVARRKGDKSEGHKAK